MSTESIFPRYAPPAEDALSAAANQVSEPQKQIHSVTSLLADIRASLESRHREVWVTGEISGLAAPPSGHRYFSLKDGGAVLRCVLFNIHRRSLAADPADGMQVLLRGRITVYEPRGDLQLKVAWLEDAGEGARRREFEALKRKLADEGLFEAAHKQPLPAYPAAIGVVSSISGAAWQDIRVTLARRAPMARLVLYPTRVQGAGAAAEIIAALAKANRRRDAEVLIVARGGGSAEDLQAFNDEALARAIFASALPVVSAVGHEIDFTIADFAADLRAATPTAAAEVVAPELTQIQAAYRRHQQALRGLMQRRLDALAQRLDSAGARLVHPMQRLQLARQTQRVLAGELARHLAAALHSRRENLLRVSARLRQHEPRARLVQHRYAVSAAGDRLQAAVNVAVSAAAGKTRHLTKQLQLVSPTNTLSRGYAILQDEREGVITDAARTHPGQVLTARVSRGKFRCVVE